MLKNSKELWIPHSIWHWDQKIKNVDTQEHKSIRTRRDCERQRALESKCAKYKQNTHDDSLNEKKQVIDYSELWQTRTKAIETNPQTARKKITITNAQALLEISIFLNCVYTIDN